MMERCDFAMSDVIKQGILDVQHQDQLFVNWQVTSMCNYQCSYCNDKHKPQKETYDKNRIFATIDNLIALGRPYYYFRLHGGEPTIFPHLKVLIDYIYAKTSQAGIQFITNGSRSPEYFTNLLTNVPQRCADIHIYIHLQFAKTTHIGNVLSAIADMQQSATVHLMYLPELKNECKDFYNFLVKLRTTLPFNIKIETEQNQPDSTFIDICDVDETLQWIRESDFQRIESVKTCSNLLQKPDFDFFEYYIDYGHGNKKTHLMSYKEAKCNGLTNFKDYYCCVGTNLIVIDQNFKWQTGSCSALQNNDFAIDNEEFLKTYFVSPVQCPHDECRSDINYILPKFKEKLSALIYCQNFSKRIEEYKKHIVENQPCRTLTTKQRVVGLLDRMELLRKGINRIDPEHMVIVVMRICLHDAVMYYKNLIPALTRMPDFVVMDWAGEKDAAIATLEQTENIIIQPIASYRFNASCTLCAFAVPNAINRESDTFETIFHALTRNGYQTFAYDTYSTSKTMHHTPNPEFLAKRLDDICTVYDALADEESKTTYLQAVKAIVSGDAGYLALSPYPQYNHPLVQAERGDVLLEGGLAGGCTTLQFAEQVGSKGKIYAFEPVSTFAGHCQHVLKDVPQVHVEQLGLWSEASTFHVEDNGCGSRLASKPTEKSEECHFIDIDSYLAQKHTSCSIIKLDFGGAEEEALKGALGAIDYNRPKLQIALHHNPDHYLDIPLMLLKKFADYKLYCGHHSTWYNKTCFYAVSTKQRFIPNLVSAPCVKNKISVIVPCYNDEPHLRRCLDSIFLQASAVDLELIVVDDASTDDSQTIIQEYLHTFPTRMRTMRFEENRGAGPARNAGMDMATGEFITFVDADDCIATDFLPRSLEKLQQEQADIVCFDMTLTYEDGRTEHCAVEPGCFSHERSLEQMLLRKVGEYAHYARTYRREMLLQHAVRFAEKRVHEDMVFSVQAFYYSKKTLVCHEIGYHRYVRSSSRFNNLSDDDIVDSFCSFVYFLTNFFKTYHLDLTSAMYRFCIEQLYKWDRISLLKAFDKAIEEKKFFSLLSEERLRMIGSSPVVVEFLLRDYAHLIYYVNEPKPHLAPWQDDWKNLAAEPLPVPSYKPYANADTPLTAAPKLSVIIQNYNKILYITNCLQSILDQANETVEIIIVDDHSTDGSYELLQDYADLHSSIRLYRMDKNCRQGVCRNVGVEKSRGVFITFIDSDDAICPTFFADGINAMENYHADVVIYDIDVQFDNGMRKYRTQIDDTQYSSFDALNAYWKGEIPASVCGKIYNRSFLIEKNITFLSNIYYEDHPYFISILTNLTQCICISTVQYIVCLSRSSSIRPSKYTWLHIYSGYVFYSTIKECSNQMGKFENTRSIGKHIIWNLENCFLPACTAYMTSYEKLPLNLKQLHELGASPLFLQEVLSGMANYWKKNCSQHDKLYPLNKITRKHHTFLSVTQPLISVIIPVFNQEDTLGRCLDSILNQPLRSFEILLIDDASTDHTQIICANYAAKDGRIRHFTNPTNKGQGFSRTFAMQQAIGKYITYVDSNDYIQPILLQHGVQKLELNNDIDIIHFNDTQVNLKGTIDETVSITSGMMSGRHVFSDFCQQKSSSYAPFGKIYRKKFLDEHSLDFAEHMWEDALFTLKSYYYAQKIFFTGLHGYTRGNTPNSASADNHISVTRRNIEGYFAQVSDLSRFFKTLDQEQYKHIFECQWKRCVQRMYDTKLFSYITHCEQRGIEVPNDKSMGYLADSPYFFKALLEDYATLYARHTGYTAKLPAEDMWPQTSVRQPADYLVTLSDRIEECAYPVVSVIVPAWNVTTTLQKCLDSILLQQVSFEIILVEDNSTSDTTLQICYEYAQTHTCIRLFQTPWNSGLGMVLNLAMQKARGKYITFVDSDDWIAPSFLQRAVYELESHSDVDILVCNMHRIFSNKSEFTTLPDIELFGLEMVESYVYGKFKHWCKVSTLYSRSFLEKYDIKCGVCFYEDEIFILNAYLFSKKILLRPFVGYYCNRFESHESIMRPKIRGKKYFDSTLYNIEQIQSFFDEHSEIDSGIRKRRINGFRWGHHRDNLLHYIYSCKELNIPSPLTEEALAKLSCSPDFLRATIREYAILAQKPLPSDKTEHKPVQQTEHKPVQHTEHKPVQHTEHKPVQEAEPKPVQHTEHKPAQQTEPKPAQQIVVSKCTPDIPNIASIGMGSFFERALWHVAPKRACTMALRRSGMVDANYYRQAYPDVAQPGDDPVYDYVHFGAQEGRNPVSWFDSRYYLLSNPDVTASGANPFYHYLRYGHQEGRKPNPQMVVD